MQAFYRQHAYNVGKGPDYVDGAQLPTDAPSNPRARLIAYYLPQFHQIPENDRWWGTGFTEWTNVTKAVPRYQGHRQPRLPADLGFYDLRNIEVLKRQAALAKRAGIHGFCFHNYWFSGRRVLETPLEMLLSDREIDLPFCLNWANEPWSRRWDGSEHEVLLKQEHSPQDDIEYLRAMLPALRDPRYIRINGRPLLMIYRPSIIPHARELVERWRSFLVEVGLGNPYIVMPQAFREYDPRKYGMDAAAGFPPHPKGWSLPNDKLRVKLLDVRFWGHVASYEALMNQALADHSTEFRLFPGVCTEWDNEARRPGTGFGFYGCRPELYGAWLRKAIELAGSAPTPDERIVFINAWNEWAEGAYLEPDRHYGHAFLLRTREAVSGTSPGSAPTSTGVRANEFTTRSNRWNVARNFFFRGTTAARVRFRRWTGRSN